MRSFGPLRLVVGIEGRPGETFASFLRGLREIGAGARRHGGFEYTCTLS